MGSHDKSKEAKSCGRSICLDSFSGLYGLINVETWAGMGGKARGNFFLVSMFSEALNTYK